MNLGKDEARAAMRLLAAVRRAGISAEIYPDGGKMKKQLEYADRRSIPYVAIIGSEELAEGVVTVKNMRSGEQSRVAAGELVEHVK